MDITELAIADGEIEELSSTRESLRIRFRDWREDRWCIEFEHFAFECIGAEGEDLTELRVEDDEEWTASVKRVVGDVPSDVRAYSFVSAWSGCVVLRVLALNCRVTPG